MSVCLRELARCESPDSLKPQLLIFSGDKYGWRPLPERILVRLFHFFEERIFSREKLELAYVQDLNAVPSYYELRSRHEISGHELVIWKNRKHHAHYYLPHHSIAKEIQVYGTQVAVRYIQAEDFVSEINRKKDVGQTFTIDFTLCSRVE